MVGKKQLVKQVAKETGLPEEQISYIYEVLVDTVEENIFEGSDVSLKKLGTFKLEDSPHGGHVSNLTGQVIPEHKIVKFKVNSKLKRDVNLKTRNDG